MDKKKRASAEHKLPSEVKFDYLKGNFFRVVHADGVFGGPTPNQQIAVTFFSERLAIPQQTAQAVKPDGTLGDEIVEKRVSRDAVVRELEVCVMVGLPVAIKLQEWLGKHIEQIRKLTTDEEGKKRR
jgi:hypothetical protein